MWLGRLETQGRVDNGGGVWRQSEVDFFLGEVFFLRPSTDYVKLTLWRVIVIIKCTDSNVSSISNIPSKQNPSIFDQINEYWGLASLRHKIYHHNNSLLFKKRRSHRKVKFWNFVSSSFPSLCVILPFILPFMLTSYWNVFPNILVHTVSWQLNWIFFKAWVKVFF